MENNLVLQWEKNKKIAENWFSRNHPNDYSDIVSMLFSRVLVDKEYDTDKIHCIDDGDYQGTLIFLIPEKTYQPSGSEYLVVEVSYGSCSGCDTLQAINGYSDSVPTEEQVRDYMTLALHIVQGLKPLFD